MCLVVFVYFCLICQYLQNYKLDAILVLVFSEHELPFMFAICCRPSVCRLVCHLSVCLSVCRLSLVTLVRPTQAVQIFRNISTTLGTLAIH